MMKWKVAFAAMIAVVALGAAVFSTTGRSVDAGVTNAVSVDCGACTFASGTATVTVDIEFTNNSGGPITLGAFNFNLLGDNQSSLNPTSAGVCAAPGTASPCNPDLILTDGNWTCGPPNPAPDQDASGTATNSFISCFNGGGTGETVANGATITLARVTFTGGTDGVTNLTLDTVNVADSLGVEVHACAPGGDTCNNATVQIGASSATNTPTALATSTNTPVATATVCQGAACPTRTSLAFITVTPTGSPTVPATATAPATGSTPPPGATAPGGGSGPGGGGPGSGGGGVITLPDTGTGAGADSSSLVLTLAGLGLAALLGGGLALNLAGATARREGK